MKLILPLSGILVALEFGVFHYQSIDSVLIGYFRVSFFNILNPQTKKATPKVSQSAEQIN